MREIEGVRQDEDGVRKRWFSDSYFDLIVWMKEGRVSSFQLAYDKRRRERVVTWSQTQGLAHFTADRAGERPARHARSAFLAASPAEDLGGVLQRFRRAVQPLDEPVVRQVLERLEESGPGPRAA